VNRKLKTPAALPAATERRRLREAAGLSGASLAALVGVAPATVYGWESGREPRGLLRDAYATVLKRLEEHAKATSAPDG